MAPLKDAGIGKHLILRLSGLIDGDDRIALADMVQQLALLDPLFKTLLENDSHPRTFSECFAFLIETIKTKLSFTTIVFVVEEIDIFTQQPKQSILYSLFDLVHISKDLPIALIGSTSRPVPLFI